MNRLKIEAQNIQPEIRTDLLQKYYRDQLSGEDMMRVESYMRISEIWREESRTIMAEYLVAQDSLWSPLAKEEREIVNHQLIDFIGYVAADLNRKQILNTDHIWEKHIAERRKYESCLVRRMLRKFDKLTNSEGIFFPTTIPVFRGHPPTRTHGAIRPSEQRLSPISEQSITITQGQPLRLYIDLQDDKYVAVLREAGGQYHLAIPTREGIDEQCTDSAGQWHYVSKNDKGQTILVWDEALPPLGEQTVWLFIAPKEAQPLKALFEIFEETPDMSKLQEVFAGEIKEFQISIE
jgi:hypothetical protein